MQLIRRLNTAAFAASSRLVSRALVIASTMLLAGAPIMVSARVLEAGAKPAEGTPVVLVVGATGGTGQEVVDLAIARSLHVRALVRDESKARTLFNDRVQYSTGDVREPRSLRRAMKGVDQVICALGSNVQRDPENSPERVDYAGVKALAEAAKAAGVSQFILVSSMGVTHPDHQLNAMLDNILEWKLKGEDAVRATGINYTIVRPGALTNEPGGQRGIRIMQGDPRNGEGSISRSDVAAVLVSALGRQDLYGKTFEIVGDNGSARIEWASLYNELQPDAR
ncbi:MAG TPA: SDR family oxidoreductase [Steroidobacteraceae bacterium]|nr:SDR family oxidoreductase [Steroidobacteraceae bacterium]